MKNSNKSGFTLVELSIVLVIIGLLIGGLLVGKSLIESAKINRLISDLRQYDVAVNQFYSKFKKIPGDSPSFAPPGNGDDSFGWGAAGDSVSCADAPYDSLFNLERFQFWAHLSQSGMIKKQYESFSSSEDFGFGTCGTNPIGETSPSTKLSGLAASYLGSQRGILPHVSIAVTKGIVLEFYTNPSWVLALENKMGATPYQGSPNFTGLGNYWSWGNGGLGWCSLDGDTLAVECSDASALYGQLFYIIVP